MKLTVVSVELHAGQRLAKIDENQSNFKQKSKEEQTLLMGHQGVRRPCRAHRGPIMCERLLTLSTGFMKARHDQSHDEPYV